MSLASMLQPVFRQQDIVDTSEEEAEKRPDPVMAGTSYFYSIIGGTHKHRATSM